MVMKLDRYMCRNCGHAIKLEYGRWMHVEDGMMICMAIAVHSTLQHWRATPRENRRATPVEVE